MGLDEVYESLVELFPLIDCRALRAVAIDHHKDVDAAVLAVVDEIIPLLESTTPLDQSICEARSEASTSGAYDGHREGVDNRPMSASGAVQSCGGPVKITSDGTIDVQDLDMGVDQIGNLTPEVESVSGQLEIDRVNKESDVLVGPSESFVSLKESTMSESREVRTVDFVEESIQEARDNKETVSMAMESVISLLRQVVLKEKAVEQAKVEAGIGGKSTLDKVEELKRMLQNAKAANEMHAGEVYGEKSILGTELKELQARVLSMSDEREKSLSVLDEVRLTLEVRLDAAENAIRSAEHEKLEKENAARKLHAEQKLVMEKVVQESKILKQQSEENTKLEEFLVDRGRAIDTLQGDLAAICQDVRVLKQKFDERAPLNRSLFSSHTSSILPSSSFNAPSSLKSLNVDQAGPLPV